MLTHAQIIFLALVKCEDDLDQVKLRVAAGTASAATLAEFEAKVAYLKAL